MKHPGRPGWSDILESRGAVLLMIAAIVFGSVALTMLAALALGWIPGAGR